MTRMDYFRKLGWHLWARGFPPEGITATVGELSRYVAESGVDPVGLLGFPFEFASRLAAGGYAQRRGFGPKPGERTWRWLAAPETDEELMNWYGAQGWEITRIDGWGRFVSHRDPARPQRWEYRMHPVAHRRDLPRYAAALAAEGWEPLGHLKPAVYFKRRLAANAGPAARIAQHPPRADHPREHWLAQIVGVLFLIAFLSVLGMAVIGGEYSVGRLILVVVGAALVVAVRQASRRKDPSGLVKHTRFPPPDLRPFQD